MAPANIRDRIVETIRGLDKLPTLPVVVALLNKEIANPNATAQSVAKIVEDDPPIMARVLKLVNSPLYAPVFSQRKDITIQAAVVRLGMKALRDLVITTSVLTSFPPKGSVAFDRNEFWKHSINCGLVAETVSKFASTEIPCEETEMLLSGLCHDIGKVVLDQYFHDEFQGVLEAAKQDHKLLWEEEARLLGIEHGEVGELLAARWKLPEPIRMAVAYHHRPEALPNKDYEPLLHLVVLSDYICNHQGLGFSGNFRTMDFPRASFELLGLDVQDIPDIIERVRDEAAKSEILLSIQK